MRGFRRDRLGEHLLLFLERRDSQSRRRRGQSKRVNLLGQTLVPLNVCFLDVIVLFLDVSVDGLGPVGRRRVRSRLLGRGDGRVDGNCLALLRRRRRIIDILLNPRVIFRGGACSARGRLRRGILLLFPSPLGARGVVRRGEIARDVLELTFQRTHVALGFGERPDLLVGEFLELLEFIRESVEFLPGVRLGRRHFGDHELNLRLRRRSLPPRALRLSFRALCLARRGLDRFFQFTILRDAFLRLDHRPLQRTLRGDEPLAKRVRLRGALRSKRLVPGTQRVQFGGDRGETRGELGGRRRDRDGNSRGRCRVPVLWFFGRRGAEERRKGREAGGRRGGRLGGDGGGVGGWRLPRRRRRRRLLREPLVALRDARAQTLHLRLRIRRPNIRLRLRISPPPDLVAQSLDQRALIGQLRLRRLRLAGSLREPRLQLANPIGRLRLRRL